MTREEALAMLVTHNSQRRMFLGETATSEALDLAIEALREHPAPEQMEFSKAFIEALREVVRISDRKHPAWDEVKAFLAALDAQEETPDEYLARLVKKASPAWENVDPQQFLDEVRGRTTSAIEWKPGPPQENGDYLLIMRHISGEKIGEFCQDWRKGSILRKRVLFHIGPIPKTPGLNK